MLAGFTFSLALAGAATHPVTPRDVSVEELVAALEPCRGYDLTATANSARLHGEAYLRLIRNARAQHPDGAPLRIGHAQWHAACLRRMGLPAEKAPIYVRLAFENRQDTLIDYRVRSVPDPSAAAGRQPLLAADVRSSWEEGPGRPKSYSYVDTGASPQLRVTSQRVLAYRLLDFGDMVVFANVRGLRGRPVTGFLGALFDLIGEVPVVESRMAFAGDGTQVARGRGKKGLIDMTQTVTVLPDGRVQKGVPSGRPDLVELEERLKRPLNLRLAPAPALPSPSTAPSGSP
jgi:hypothetical protein